MDFNRDEWYLRDGLQAVRCSAADAPLHVGWANFLFSCRHEEYPIYHMPVIQKIIKNGVRWCVPVVRRHSLHLLDNGMVNPSTEEVYLSHQKQQLQFTDTRIPFDFFKTGV